MNNLELVSYKEYPQDPYTKAICVVCIDGKYNVAYGKKLTKEGKSWWAPATFQVMENGTKTYTDSFEMDSNKANEKLLEFVKQSAHNSPEERLMRHVDALPKSMDEVADVQGLPF